MDKEIVKINGKVEEIYTSIPKEEIEDNTDLLDLEDTLDLSEIVNNE